MDRRVQTSYDYFNLASPSDQTTANILVEPCGKKNMDRSNERIEQNGEKIQRDQLFNIAGVF